MLVYLKSLRNYRFNSFYPSSLGNTFKLFILNLIRTTSSFLANLRILPFEDKTPTLPVLPDTPPPEP